MPVAKAIELLSFSDGRWARITSAITEPLSAENDARLRVAITACCSWYLTQRKHLRERNDSAAAMRSPGNRQPAPFERLAKGLRMAADAWKNIGEIHDDQLGDIDLYNNLEALARDAERRLAGLGKLGKPITTTWPWHEFIRKVARCCNEVGLKPTATGRLYEHGKPTWFQKFLAALNDNLLGDEAKGKQLWLSRAAFYTEIAKAMRGDKNSGKAQK